MVAYVSKKPSMEDFYKGGRLIMPCGGIIICGEPPANEPSSGCWVCNKGGCRHFLIEWDAYIHARCAVKALADDVAIVINHKHEINLDFNLEKQ
jgi:hypothetical protein